MKQENKKKKKNRIMDILLSKKVIIPITAVITAFSVYSIVKYNADKNIQNIVNDFYAKYGPQTYNIQKGNKKIKVMYELFNKSAGIFSWPFLLESFDAKIQEYNTKNKIKSEKDIVVFSKKGKDSIEYFYWKKDDNNYNMKTMVKTVKNRDCPLGEFMSGDFFLFVKRNRKTGDYKSSYIPDMRLVRGKIPIIKEALDDCKYVLTNSRKLVKPLFNKKIKNYQTRRR